jgi:dihydrofolate synthase/folylpolyglutamate synthase
LSSQDCASKDLAPKDLVAKDLTSWLSYIESLHPKSIAMGLDRVRLMVDRLQLHPAFPIIAVAGTNGKGSTCAMLEQIYKQAGYQVGCYASPHLLRYNERVRVDGNEVSDQDLCAAFTAVDAARVDANNLVIPLTYFEVGTLAAMWHFMQTGVDIAILEIGLGGRLDAVNAFEPSCAIVTSVDLDHQEFLGDTRESIGFEKAGIYRPSIPAICGDTNPPASLVAYAHEIEADFKCLHQDFDYISDKDGWQYKANGKVVYTLPLPALQGSYQLNNAACAITAVESLQSSLPVATEAIANAMLQVKLVGRFQTVSRQTLPKSPQVILDVAHNPHAARALAENLRLVKMQQGNSRLGKTYAVFAMLADKDIKGVIDAVKNEIDGWYVAGIDHARGALATDLAVMIANVIPKANIKVFNSADNAYLQACIDIEACKDANGNDKIIVFGSFFTVATVMQLLSHK